MKQPSLAAKMKQLVFYYDVVCPFAYVASTIVEQLAVRNGCRLEWKPVLLCKSFKL